MRRVSALLQAPRGPEGVCASSAPARATGSCSPPMAVPAGSASIPSRKSRSITFLPGTPILSFGTAGCNLTCKFCQNWDISKSREVDTLCDEATAGMIADAAVETGCRSVAFTYNDPVIFLEYAVDVAEACHARGLKTVAVTRRLHLRRTAGGVLPPHGCRQRRSEVLHRGVLSAPVQRPPAAGSGHARVPQARNRRLVRDHHVADSRRERLRCRTGGHDPMGGGRIWDPTCPCIFPRFIPTGR